jgi:membrane protein DedA with SNARE-associated domain
MITELILNYVLGIIDSIGYFGVFLLMAAESTLLPVPSEAVLPFAGYLVAQGQMEAITLIIFATLGTILGSLISYYIGKYIGKEIILKYGKYFFVSKKELETAHTWFEKKGEKTIFVSRFIPVIRHVISLPAGAAEMKRRKFITYTAVGGLCWNTILVIAGIQLEKHWAKILNYSEILDIAILLGALALVCFFIARKRKKVQ